MAKKKTKLHGVSGQGEKKTNKSIPSDVIERLKKEKEQSEDQYFEQGCSEGKMAAQHMNYDELREIASDQAVYAADSSLDSFDPDIAYKSSVWNEWLKDELDQQDPGLDVDNYLRGWIKGVVEFWDEVEDKL